MNRGKFHKVLVLVSFLFVAVLYLLTLHGLAGNIYPDQNGKNDILLSNRPPFETSLERGRYAQIVSIGRNRVFHVDDYASFLRPDLAWYNGHYYSAFPPGVAVLSVPLFILGDILGFNLLFAYATTSIAAIGTGFVIYFIGKKLGLSTHASLFASLVLCLASGFWSYSVTVSAHPFSSLIISLLFLLTLHLKRGEGNFRIYALIWLLFGLNLFIDYPNLFIASPIMAYALYKGVTIKTKENRYRLKFSFKFFYGGISIAFVLILFVVFNMYHYKRPIAFTNQFNLQALERLGVDYDEKNLSNSLFEKKAYSNRFQISRLPSGSFTLTFSSDRGLFYYFPVFLVGLYGFVRHYKHHKNASTIALLTVSFNLLLYSIFDDPWGGWSYGPRYLLPSLPLLAVFVGAGFEYIMRKGIVGKAILIFLLFASIGVSLLGPLSTNAVPPAIEAAKGIPSNFMASFRYIPEYGSSSFVYNQYLKQIVSPFVFSLILFICVGLLFTFVFVTYSKKNDTKI